MNARALVGNRRARRAQTVLERTPPRAYVVASMRVAALAFGICALAPAPAAGAAQLPLDKFFDKVTDLSISVVSGGFAPRSPQLKADRGGLIGASVELLFEVGGIGRLKAPADTSDPRFLLELGVGFAQHTAFRSRNDSIDLRGSVQELPAIALYGTDQAGKWLSWYWTLRTGFLGLQDVRAYTSGDTAYGGTASAMQMGAGLGLLFARQRSFGAFLEVDWNYRHFGGVDWTPVDGRVPRDLPRELSFTGWSVALGAQVQFRNPD
jgi:hypothetical protein